MKHYTATISRKWTDFEKSETDQIVFDGITGTPEIEKSVMAALIAYRDAINANDEIGSDATRIKVYSTKGDLEMVLNNAKIKLDKS